MNTLLLNNIVELFSYDQWATEILMQNVSKLSDEEYCQSLTVPFNSVNGLLQHLYYYQEKTLQKITQPNAAKKIEVKLPRSLLAEYILRCVNNSLAWALECQTTQTLIDAQTLQTIHHIHAHNNYHRGQLQVALSILGHEPKSLDIFLYRDQTDTKIL